MEVAALIVSILFLAIIVLQCYQTGKKLSNNVKKKKMHVQSLVRALKGYDTIIHFNVEWLLRSTNVYDDYDDDTDVPDLEGLLKEKHVQRKVEDYLGPSGAELLQEVLLEVHEVLELIARGIDGFLAHDEPLENLSMKSVRETKIHFRDGVKLALKKEAIDDYIAKLKTATDIIMKMQSVRATIQVCTIFKCATKILM